MACVQMYCLLSSLIIVERLSSAGVHSFVVAHFETAVRLSAMYVIHAVLA